MKIDLNDPLLIEIIQSGQLSSAELKKTLLDLISSGDVSTTIINSFLKQIHLVSPQYFDEYRQIDGETDERKNEKFRWDGDYFSAQKFLTTRNFSYQRLLHLLEVQTYLQQLGIKGFSMQPHNNLSNSSYDNHVHGEENLKNYQPDEDLKVTVEKGNINYIRGLLSSRLMNNNKSWKEIDLTYRWILSSVPNLNEPYKEANYAQPISENKNSWTSDYYYLQEVYLLANFCERRWFHLIEVRKHLAAMGDKGFFRKEYQPSSARVIKHENVEQKTTSAVHQRNQKTNQQRQQSSENTNSTLKAAVKLGGILAVLAALVIAILR